MMCPMTYCFRLPLPLGDISALDCADTEWLLTDLDALPRVALTALDATSEITDARVLALRGSGYASREEAAEGARVWTARLMLVFAKHQVGANFGLRVATGGGLSADARAALELEHKAPIVFVSEPLQIFECEPAPVFLSLQATARITPSKADLQGDLQRVIEQNLTLSRQARTAYVLYASSFFVADASADARFVLLVAALESLIEQAERPAVALGLIDELLEVSRTRGEPDEDTASIRRSIENLRQESIGLSGRLLVDALEPRRYMSSSPREFFSSCYAMRSDLVHGRDPIPERAAVDLHASNLAVLVGDLIWSLVAESD
jgi:hypothetical protein